MQSKGRPDVRPPATPGHGPARPADSQSPGRAVVAATAMVALLLALVLLLAGLFVWQGQRDVQAAMESRASSAAYTASTHVRWLVEASRQALRRAADVLETRPDIFSSPGARDIGEAVAFLPPSIHMWVFNADGDSVLTNEPVIGPYNIAHRDYFQEMRNGRDWIIGSMIVGGLSKRKLFPIGQRLERDGRFLGAVITYVPADLLAQFWESMNLGPGSTVGLLREDGWLVARHPVPEAPLDLSGYILFTRYLNEAPEGTYQADASPADGVSRMVGYRRVDGLPLVVAVGIPVSTVEASVWQRMGEIALVILPVGLALLAVALWVVRLLHREESTRAALAEALEQNRMLFREIHHRVKNNLQTVSALVHLHPGSAAAKADLSRRIAAMTAVHEHIYGSDQYDRVDIADYIATLVASLRDGYGTAVTVECRLAPVVLDAELALPLGLIVNEVVSNAFKHAFPDGRAGTILVSLAADRPGEAVLEVQDDGVGFTPGERGTGMGSRLIRGLAHQMGARHAFHAEGGTRFVLTFPLDSATRRPSAPPHPQAAA